MGGLTVVNISSRVLNPAIATITGGEKMAKSCILTWPVVVAQW
jgi:hypothetical protein